MSSFKNAQKSNQKVHRERSQPEGRKHLGILEKKKDYKKRADDHQRKQNTIKLLKRKAQDRNPDEFYFKMVRTRTKEGVHQAEDEAPKYTEEQLKLMQTQDLRYINYRRSLELKKIERLKASLHMLDAQDKPKNKHIIFVDTKKEVKEFDPVKHFDTHPSLLDRAYNRPRLDTLKQAQIQGRVDPETMVEMAEERKRKYRELANRIQRERQLHIIAQKMEVKQQLVDKKTQKKKILEETKDRAAVYKWVPKRKR